MSTFAKLHPRLQEQIVATLGWTGLRPVQDLAGEAIIAGKNCIILAPTAGGKTEAAFFPIISQILQDGLPGLRAIYISPLRALLNNQEERVQKYARMVALDAFKWHGDVAQSEKKDFLKDNQEILLTTPESLEAMLVSSRVASSKLFKNLSFVVIDEIHALAAVDRGAQLLGILERLHFVSKQDFQRIGLSATVGNPKFILDWLQGSSLREKALVDPPKEVKSRKLTVYYRTAEEDNTAIAGNLAKEGKTLFFCDTRGQAEGMGRKMQALGIPTFVHHSSLALEERERAELQFMTGENACIVSTSTMELGIDVGDLDRVLQHGTPSSVASFLQRLGRTGRRANTFSNMTILTNDRFDLLQAIGIIELAKKGWVEGVEPSARNWPVLLQQIMALCLEYGGIRKSTLIEIISASSAFSSISATEFESFLQFLITHEFLFYESDLLSMGTEAEKEFGRMNFMRLLAVFSSSIELVVTTSSGREIGSIQREFAEKIIPGQTCFILGGKPWLAERIDWQGMRMFVSQAPGGKKPEWLGYMPKLITFDLAQMMKSILLQEQDIVYLDEEATVALRELRLEFSQLIRGARTPFQIDGNEVTWWTFAGGYVNHSIKYALALELPVDISLHNLYLKIKLNKVAFVDLEQTILRLVVGEYWRNDELYEKLLSQLPGYRISKFQAYLPKPMQKEVVGEYLLNLTDTRRFCDGVLER